MTANQDLAWLRSRWQLAACSQFIRLFWGAWKLGDDPIRTDDLEQAFLLEPGSEQLAEHQKLFEQLCMALTKTITHYYLLNEETWPKWFLQLADPAVQESVMEAQRVWEEANPVEPPVSNTDASASSPHDSDSDEADLKIQRPRKKDPSPLERLWNWRQWTPEQRLMRFYAITEKAWQDSERFRSHIPEKDMDEHVHWRVDPVGWDCWDRIYWLFDDHRLYRETTPEARRRMENPDMVAETAKGRKKSKKEQSEEPEGEQGEAEWELICSTLEEWRGLIENHLQPMVSTDGKQARTVRQRTLRTLISTLEENIVPEIITILEEEEKERKAKERLKRQLGASALDEEAEDWLGGRKRSTRLVMLESAKMAEGQGRRPFSGSSGDDGFMSSRSRRKAEMDRKREENEREELLKGREWRLLRRQEMQARKELGLKDSASDSDSSRGGRRKRKATIPKKKGKGRGAKRKRSGGRRRRSMDSETSDESDESMETTDEEEADDSWFFNCECGKKGINFDDGLPMMACGRCNVWLHIHCAENTLKREDLAKNPNEPPKPRDWNQEEFLCWPCREFLNHQKQDSDTGSDEIVDVVGDSRNSERTTSPATSSQLVSPTQKPIPVVILPPHVPSGKMPIPRQPQHRPIPGRAYNVEEELRLAEASMLQKLTQQQKPKIKIKLSSESKTAPASSESPTHPSTSAPQPSAVLPSNPKSPISQSPKPSSKPSPAAYYPIMALSPGQRPLMAYPPQMLYAYPQAPGAVPIASYYPRPPIFAQGNMMPISQLPGAYPFAMMPQGVPAQQQSMPQPPSQAPLSPRQPPLSPKQQPPLSPKQPPLSPKQPSVSPKQPSVADVDSRQIPKASDTTPIGNGSSMSASTSHPSSPQKMDMDPPVMQEVEKVEPNDSTTTDPSSICASSPQKMDMDPPVVLEAEKVEPNDSATTDPSFI